MTTHTIRSLFAAAALALAVTLTPAAHAALTIDLRAPASVSPDGKQIDIRSLPAGTRIPIDVYATVPIGDPARPEGLGNVIGALISQSTGGTGVSGRIIPAGDMDSGGTIRLVAIAPFNATGAAPGASMNIPLPGQTETDIFTDLGDVTRRSNLGNLVAVHSASMTTGNDFLIGRVELELGDVRDGVTSINFYFRETATGGPHSSAVEFMEDGAVKFGITGDYAAGAPIVLVPEPTLPAVAAGLAAGMLFVRRRRTLAN